MGYYFPKDGIEKLEKFPDNTVGIKTAKTDRWLRHESIKHFIDIAGAVFGLIIFSPILALSIILLYLSGCKKIFFKQERIGRFGKPFMLYKLATMEDNAHLDGPLVSRANDTRVTKIGKLLRRTNVNELPQFVNVLKGEMSIVGPRPEVARYIENWSPRIKEKILSMRPGITGYTTTKYWKESLILDSIKDSEHYYLYNLTPEKLRLDEWYVDNWNSFFDIKIMLKTLYRAFSGARKANSISENIEYNGKSTGKVSLKYYRKYPRVPLNTTIYSKSINEPIGYSRDVSLGGMFIDVKESVEPGKMINLRFELPNHPYPIKAIAKIIWNKTKSNPKLINSVGVEFIRISAIERLKLKNYLESSLSNYIKSYSLD